MPRSPVEALHHILFLDVIQVKWGLVELQIMFNRQPSALMGQSPQIYTVSHVWTFEFHSFLSFGYATFEHKSQ